MAVYFQTNDPHKLLELFKKKISEKAIVTWEYDKDGDFTHSPTQWRNLAWFKAETQLGKLAFYMIPPKEKPISSLVYAIYHGRLIESMLHHCDTSFSNSNATAFPEGTDKVN